MKISEVVPICKDVGFITERSQILELVEEPCLPACLELYDKNIFTTSSSANGNTNIAEIVIAYDYLSDENKSVIESLRLEGCARGEKGNSGRDDDDVELVVPINESSTVLNVQKSFLDIVNNFKNQDVLYGFRTLDEAKESYEKAYYYTFENLEEFVDFLDQIGKVYDEQEGLVWDSRELMNKHKSYLAVRKR